MAERIQEPEKELRFTRSGQAVPFWIAAAVCVSAALTILACSIYREINPLLPSPWWALPLVLVAWGVSRLALRMTRHAYLILTPLGMEIFPFFRPEKTMRLVLWQEIQGAEVDPEMRRLTLHHDEEKTSGIHLSLAPIRKENRALLAKAIRGRVSGG